MQTELKEEKEVRLREEKRAEELSKTKTELEQENEDLLHRADALLETQNILEEAAEMLSKENGDLTEQVCCQRIYGGVSVCRQSRHPCSSSSLLKFR